jgi:hypothetical protein
MRHCMILIFLRDCSNRCYFHRALALIPELNVQKLFNSRKLLESNLYASGYRPGREHFELFIKLSYVTYVTNNTHAMKLT